MVGVNGGKPFTTNRCLASELTWAKGAVNQQPAFYVNTANGGPNNGQWPSSQTAPDACAGANSVPCSYDYGWNAARYSFAAALTAESADGATSPNQAAIASPWWLDVETGNAWEVKSNYYGPTAAAYANDTAMIEGEIASLENAGVTSVGVYSTSQQWRAITDASTSNFPSVPAWIPGFGSVAAAQAGCATTSFTSGRVALIQYGAGSYDGDYNCGLLNTPLTTSVTAANSATFSDQLVTTNNNGPVTYVETSGSPDLVERHRSRHDQRGARRRDVHREWHDQRPERRRGDLLSHARSRRAPSGLAVVGERQGQRFGLVQRSTCRHR